MKILVLMGSPRKGNTYKLTKLIENKMNEYGDVDFEYLFVDDLDLKYCTSCHVCFLRGEEKCRDSEVVKEIDKKMEEADGLILASPVYSMQVSAALKNLIDHISYFFHRPRFFDKKAMAIVTTAGGGCSDTLKYLSKLTRYWGYNYCHKFGVITHSLEYEITDKIEKKGKKLAQKFYHDIKTGKLYSPSMSNIIYFNVWKALNLNEIDQKSADLKYWTETGLIESNYHTGIKLNPVKKVVSGVFKKLFAHLLQ